MGIRLVYGLQSGDASYLEIFHPSRRLKEAALAAGLDYAAMIFSPSSTPSQVLDFCRGHAGEHVALLRGELPDSLFSHLESEGIRVVNPATAVALARDKLASAAFFSSIGTRHPRTAIPHGPELPLPLPFVAKPRYGKMGRGVALMESPDQWSEYHAEAQRKGQETIVQELIKTTSGRDIRFFFADFEAGSSTAPGAGHGSAHAPGWVCVMRNSPGFLSNAHAGGSMTAFNPPVTLQYEAQRIFTRSGLLYGTVDFLFANEDGSDFVVCEMNANPGFEELERATGIDVAGAIIASVNKATKD